MTKYFISGQSTGGSLAVEKHLNRYFHEHYFHTLVSEDKVADIIADLEAAQDRYFQGSRGKRVAIGKHASYDGGLVFLSIGALTYTLIKIEREIL